MNSPVLATKLFIPPPPPKGVLRPRLIERLNEGLHRKLSLISAPAGFGKTTLVSEWAAGFSRINPQAAGGTKIQTAWLSLDEADSDPARFLTYLVAALQSVAQNMGEELEDILQSTPPWPIEPILIAVLNKVSTISGQILHVLDDYHVIESKLIDEAVTYLIEHLPPQLHLVITTREDPQLPLARLRARGQLTELRASDLRFTPFEAADFLAGMGIHLAPEEIAALEERTEGWIAGLQLSALAVQGSQDIPEFFRAFSGDHRYIMDYLVEEVLQRQPETARNFLREAAASRILPMYMSKLLAAFEGGRQPGAGLLVEPLSQRELDVLRMFKTDLSGPEIAQELMIALSTVRTHTKGIFSKLYVNNRRAAVRRAEELHLI